MPEEGNGQRKKRKTATVEVTKTAKTEDRKKSETG